MVVEDGDTEREALARMLRLERFDVETARNPAEAMTKIDDPVDLVVSDLRMGAQTGIDLLKSWRERRPTTPFILLTAFGDVPSAVAAMKLGASDFLSKPVDPLQLLTLIQETLDIGDRPMEGSAAQENEIWEGIVGRSPVMINVRQQTIRAANTSSTVLVFGESGTGKELIAEAIHRQSRRKNGPFVVVNIAALPDSLVESELFGHVKGAFTHAVTDRVGRFRAAHGGTLFIDEVGDFPLHLQAKLLRVLEQRAVCPVGTEEEIPVDVRVVAATSRPLAKMIASSEFREDLFYRLNVLAIQLPPLRERREDIAPLTDYFLKAAPPRADGTRLRLAPDLLQTLEQLPWPGNVRQLKNCLERMSVMASGDTLTKDDLPLELLESLPEEGSFQTESRMETLKRSAIMDALRQFDGNRTRAAQFLGVSVRTLQRKLREWGQAGEG